MDDQGVRECLCGCGKPVVSGRWLRGHAAHKLIRERNVWGPPKWGEQDRGHETLCWIWTGALSNKGFGTTRWRGKDWKAHRRSWIEARRELVAGLELDHLCGERSCVNPDHLEQIHHAENTRRGRSAKLTPAQVGEIRERYAAGGITQTQLAVEFGVRQTSISNIVREVTW